MGLINYCEQRLTFLTIMLVVHFEPSAGIVDNVTKTNETPNASGTSHDGLFEFPVDMTTLRTGLNYTRDLCEKRGERSLVSTNSCGTTSGQIQDAIEDAMNTTVASNVSLSSGTNDIYFVYYPFGVISVAGNIMIVIIMSRSGNKGRSTSFLFIMLAISDTALTANNMYFCTIQGLKLDSNRQLTFGIITNLIWRINVQFSNFILMVITTERVVSIAFPLKVKIICRKAHLKAVLLFIIAVLTVANIPLWFKHWWNGDMESIESVDLFLGFCIPFIAILIGGIYIIIKVKYGLLSKSQHSASVTNIVLMANLAFFITMLPRRIIYLLPDDVLKTELPIIACQYFECLNTGVNFFVYILASRKFREHFINLIRGSKPASKIENGSARRS